MNELSHFNRRGEAYMVDIGGKAETRRVAIAEGRIVMQRETLARIVDGDHRKGDVLGIARVAGIMGTKRTADLVPLCHPIAVSHVEVALEPDPDTHAVTCRARVESTGKTGVEMEALTAVQVALLTIYDMCKAVDRGMEIDGVRLVHKSGGKSGTWDRETARA